MNKVGVILVVGFLMGCASEASLKTQKTSLNKILADEFQYIENSLDAGSRIGIDWCIDTRYSETAVTTVSDYAQRQIEKHFVELNKFTVVTRRYLDKIIKEQELQTRHFIDEKTAVSNTHNLGLSLLVIPEITKDGSLSIQVIDADNSSIKYITIRDF
ncbi:MAG: hypothetical protein LBH43_06920 [Treponema sp.]|jgi:hypothetical protein|nr:hypothetical protein [Treponema sp.]